jgi:hypothetical protein
MSTEIARHAADLERLLKLRSIPSGMKMFEDRAGIEALALPPAVPAIRHPAGRAGRHGEELPGPQARLTAGGRAIN